MKNIFNKLALGFIAAGLLTACANDDDYGNPLSGCTNPGLTANVTVQQVVAENPTAAPVLYDTDDIIEGYITSSDERGNFFKTVSVQTMPTDGSNPVGFSIAIDRNGLFGKGFIPGNKVYVRLKDLYTAKEFGSLKIGAFFQETGEPAIVGRIPENEYASKVFISSCEKVDEDALVTPLTISQALNDSRINTLIELQNVQFEDSSLGIAYYDEDRTEFGVYPFTIGGATNHRLVDENGNKIIFRTSSFANFAGSIVPEGSGTVRGVLTKFCNGSGQCDYQFIARYESDIMLDQPRIGDENPGGENPGGEGPGEDAVLLYPGSDFEDSAAFAAGITSFGIKSYATVSPGTGMEGGASLHINTSGTAANEYVFNSNAAAGLPENPTKITFYVKGTSAKSLSINIYKQDGSTYHVFNLGDVTGSKVINVAETNQYTGIIDTDGEWVLITLDLTGITDLNLTNTNDDIFALKVGKEAAYDLHLDNFKIE